MMLQLFKIYLKESIRSLFSVVNVASFLFAVYLFFNLLVLGLLSPRILEKTYPEANLISKFTELFFYYLLIDILLRFLFQSLPTTIIQPFLILPIKKRILVNYPLVVSLFNFFNIIPFILILPFAISVVAAGQSLGFILPWAISLLALGFVNNFLNWNLKRYFQLKPILTIVFLLLLVACIYLDFNQMIHISEYFAAMMVYLSDLGIAALLMITLLVGIYILTFIKIKRQLYLEDLVIAKKKNSSYGGRLKFLETKGELGQLIMLEIKLIWRNKRPKTLVFMGLFFLIYGLMFYQNEIFEFSSAFLVFVGVFMTGAFMLNYGQLMFSWESSFFDGLLVLNISPLNIIKAKYWFLFVTCILCFVLTTPYGFFDYRILFINFSCLLFNLGVNSFILLLLTENNKKRVDLSKSAMMNYEGFGLTQFILGIPLLGLPALIYLPFSLLDRPTLGYVFIALAGICGIILREPILAYLARRLAKKKYVMAAGFRKI
jgi:hypothetical protein